MSELPDGWEWSTIGEVAEVNPRLSKADLSDDDPVSFVPMASVSAESGQIDTSDVQAAGPLKKKSFRQFADGDVLVAKITPSMENGKGAVARGLASGRGFGSTEFHVLRPSAVEPDFLLQFVLQPRFRGDAARNMTGTAGQLRVPPDYLRQHPIPVPPLPEQRRIVAAIEEYFSRLDAAEAGLNRGLARAPRLTMAQREVEFADESVVAPIEDVAADHKNALAIGPFGSNLKVSDYRDDGVPLVFVRDIRRRSFGGEGTRYVDQAKAIELSSHTVRTGDVLVTKMGDPPGDVALYDGPDAVITADCIKITPAEGMRADYLAEALQTARSQRQIESITKGVAQRKVSLGRFRTDVAVPSPDIARQQSVVERIADVAQESERLVASIKRAQRMSAALRRSILAAAFSGQLVAQDPADEPAYVLLERIAAERAASNPSSRNKKAAS